jgi:hypothetical protein
MNYELTFTTAAVLSKPLAAWSIPDAPPASPAGIAVARTVDTGFPLTAGTHEEPWDQPDHRELFG